MMVDFYLIKRQRVDITDLYRPSQDSRYYYRKGVNPRAVAAFVPGAVVAAVCALTPALATIAPFAWFIGVAISGGLYYLLARGQAAAAARDPAPGYGLADESVG